jgi:uncharacterized membrane protein YcaP (DUF421 family)
MGALAFPDWASVFVPDASLAESFLRGTVVYLSVVVLFRVVLRRQGGAIGLPDIMLVVLVSECVSASLSADTRSVPNGLAAVSALLFWNYSLDRLEHRWPWLQRLLEPSPLPLVRDGVALRENLDSEGITDDELKAQLRLNGVEDVSGVKLAILESGGCVSVIPREKGDERHTAPAPAADRASAPGEPDLDAAVRQFLSAAAGLRAAAEWHEGRAADHRAAAKAARELLASHGVRPARAVHPTEPPSAPEAAR